jgi:hypothetical protein
MLRELNQRSNGGIITTLWWDDVEDTMTVIVEDHEESAITIEHIPGSDWKAAFYHPFSYQVPAPSLLVAVC